MTTTTFKTLLRREWMQHGFGWLLMGAAPFVIMVPLMSFGQIQVGNSPPPGWVALIIAFGYIFFLMAIAGAALAFQAPGLARRDRQDRSIEFWLSLPIGHTEAVGATVLMHFFAMPLLLLGLAALGSPVAALIAEGRVNGLGALAQMPWGIVAIDFVAGVARLALGVVLGVLWLSPMLLAAMAASAWLKRWGVPVLAAVVGLGGLLLDKAYDIRWVWEALGQQFIYFGHAVFPQRIEMSPNESLSGLPAMLAQDTQHALSQLTEPAFAIGLLIAVACFGLVVWRRARH